MQTNFIDNKEELTDENTDIVKRSFKVKKDNVQQISLDGEVVELQKTLVDRYIVPPFSVLDTRQGYWQKRRRAWLSLGIKSELGRNVGCMPKGFDKERYGVKMAQETSIFDPVICEVFYRWFNIEKGSILDPFAGGSVRGIVASYMDYRYVGIELRQEQVDANFKQAKEIGVTPSWTCGDSFNIDKLPTKVDMVFTCPPYYDLEVYSDLPGELSALPTYESFIERYSKIIGKTVNKLRDNRFAVFIVSNFRDKNGFYHTFTSDTIKAFEDSGMPLYNECVLINTAGTLPIRINNQFRGNRKMGKMHQNVLVFYKGNVDRIKEIFPKDV